MWEQQQSRWKRCSQSWMGDNPDDSGNNENEEILGGAGSQWRVDEVGYIWQSICWPFSGSPLPNCQIFDGENVPQTGFQSDSGQEARRRPRDRLPAILSDEDIVTIYDMGSMDQKMGRLWKETTRFLSCLLRISNLQHSCLRQWSILPGTMRTDVTTAHLCHDTSINGSWNRRKTENAEMPKVNKDNMGGNYGVHSSACQAHEEEVSRTLLA